MKKSVPHNAAKVAIASSKAARDVSRAIVPTADAPVDVVVDAVDFHLWAAVEAAWDEAGEDGLTAALLDAFEVPVAAGDHVPDAAARSVTDEFGTYSVLVNTAATKVAISEALNAHARVKTAAEKEARELGRPVVVGPNGHLDDFFKEYRASMTPPPPSDLEIIEFTIRRARELGVPAKAVLEKQQGTRSDQHNRIKHARAQIVLVLRERGASRPALGRVFGGRTRESIRDIEKLGRKLRAEQGATDGQ